MRIYSALQEIKLKKDNIDNGDDTCWSEYDINCFNLKECNKRVRKLNGEVNEKYFRNRPAMLDEFNSVIKNLNDYIK